MLVRIDVANQRPKPVQLDSCVLHPGSVATETRKGGQIPVDASVSGMRQVIDGLGLEMSGNPAAFRDMLDNMCHGGKIAMLGIPESEMAIDWNHVVFNMLTIKGIYGREMYETWYKMTVMLQGGLDISPVITHRYHYTEFEQGFQTMLSGESGKVILDWRES